MISEARPRASRTLNFGLALIASLAVCGVVAASASALSYTWSGAGPGVYSKAFKYTEFKITSGEEYPVTCSSGGGTGSFKTGVEGKAQLEFYGCNRFPMGQCTTPGSSPGNIRTTVLSITPVYLDAAKTRFGIKYTPETPELFAEFSCGSLTKVKWLGDVLSEVTAPGLNVESNYFDFKFGSGVPFFVEGTGLPHMLRQQVGSGTIRPLQMNTIATMRPLTENFKGKFIP